MQSAQQSEPEKNLTLGEINTLLNRAGLPAIPRDKAKTVVTDINKARFVQAVTVAHENLSAARFAARVLIAGGLEVSYPPELPGGTTNPDHPVGAKSTSVEPPSSQPAHTSQRENSRSDTDYYQAHAEQASQPTASPDREMDSETDGWGESFHVYGGKAALCFNADRTRSGTHTIALDAASTLAPKVYDWKNKIRIQFTRGELPVVAAVLLGFKQECEFKNHGPGNDKGFSLKRQDGGKIFASVFAAGQPLKAVPIFAPDLMWVAALVLQQVQKNCPGIDSVGVIELIRATQ